MWYLVYYIVKIVMLGVSVLLHSIISNDKILFKESMKIFLLRVIVLLHMLQIQPYLDIGYVYWDLEMQITCW